MTFFSLNEDDSSSTRLTILRERNSKTCGSAQGQDYRNVRVVDVEQGPVAETAARVRRGSLAGHFPNTQCAHNGAPISRAASDDLNVSRTSTEFFHLVSQTEYVIEIGGVRP
jgi:hypothetical protein